MELASLARRLGEHQGKLRTLEQRMDASHKESTAIRKLAEQSREELRRALPSMQLTLQTTQRSADEQKKELTRLWKSLEGLKSTYESFVKETKAAMTQQIEGQQQYQQSKSGELQRIRQAVSAVELKIESLEQMRAASAAASSAADAGAVDEGVVLEVRKHVDEMREATGALQRFKEDIHKVSSPHTTQCDTHNHSVCARVRVFTDGVVGACVSASADHRFGGQDRGRVDARLPRDPAERRPVVTHQS